MPEDVYQKCVRKHRAPGGARWTNFRNNTVTIGDQNRLTSGGKPDILTQLIFERFEANGAHKLNVATRGYFVKRCPWMAFSVKPCSFPGLSPYGLSKPHTGTAAVLVDELHAGRFQGTANG
jgi:hypothetical protein